jgi:urease accessory protein UreE
MKRRWRIVLMRKTGQVLGTVEAAAPHAAEKVAAIQFELDEFQRRRLLVHTEGNGGYGRTG